MRDVVPRPLARAESACNCCRRSLASDARRGKSSWPTWTILIVSRTRRKSLLTQGGSTTLSVWRDGSPWPHPQTWPTSTAQRGCRSGLADAALQPLGQVGLRSTHRRSETPKKKAIVAVARKLLVRCWVMLLRKEPWNKESLITISVGVVAVG